MRRIEHTLTDFPMPDSTQIEHRILASVISDTTYFSEVLRVVKREFFSSDKNRAVWDVVVDMYNKGESVDMSTVFPQPKEAWYKKYGVQMIEAFCLYWCEADKKGVMACEKAKKRKGTFEIGGRLATWAGKEYNKPTASTPQRPVAQPRKPKKTPWEEMGLSYEDYVKLNKGGLF